MRASIHTPAVAAVLLSATMLAGCATYKPPQISYDANVPPLPPVPAAVIDTTPKPLHIPPAWTPARGGTAAGTPLGRVENGGLLGHGDGEPVDRERDRLDALGGERRGAGGRRRGC